MHDDRFRFGALPLDRSRTEFRLQAAGHRRVTLETDDGRRFDLDEMSPGEFGAVLPLPPGTRYRYRLVGNGPEIMTLDPAARGLSGGADGFGVVVDPANHPWQHDAWRGRPWHEAVLCELDSKAPGGFEGAIARLPALVDLGITAIGLDPVARLGDTVLPFAPDPARGEPDDLRRLVDAAHGLGLMVVVGGIRAPRGPGLPVPGDARFVTECACQWIVDYRVDGLWLAADVASEELALAVQAASGPHRRVHLLLDGGGALPAGFDAGRQSGAVADTLPVTARVARSASGPATAGPADLARLLLSPSIPCLVDDGAPVVSTDPAGEADPPCRRLLRLRAERLVPHLPGTRRTGLQSLAPDATVSSWTLGDGSRLVLGSNLGGTPVAWPDAPVASHRVFAFPIGSEGPDLPAGGTCVYIVPGLPKDLAHLAVRAGIALEWSDQGGRPHTVSRDTVTRVLEALGHPCDTPQAIVASLAALRSAEAAPTLLTGRVGERIGLPLPDGFGADGLRATLTLESGETRELLPAVREVDSPGAAPLLSFDGFDVPGYHRLAFTAGDRTLSLDVAIAPAKAFDAGLARAWGTSVQLYALRPETKREGPDPGLGDFSALAAFARSAGAAGAQVVAISPTHAGFAADASNFSPYSPSSRLFHNVLFIDPLTIDGAGTLRPAAAPGADLDLAAAASVVSEPLIDWQKAAAIKLRWLRAIFERQPPGPSRPVPDALRLHATFEALHAHFHAQGRFDWRQWPEAFQDPESAEVAAFAETHADEVRFHIWLQHLAEEGLQRAQDAARDAGMRVGLVADLAIGMSGAGSHAWASRRDLLVGLEIGAPPDSMNPRGQSWGLTAFSPRALAERRYEPFLQTLRAAMRQAGGVRIDHVLGLNRLWLVPDGLPATDGAYVSYPFRDFMNLLILESHRQRAIVIGEDLGTVPDGFREALADAGVRGMAVLWLERASDGVGFRPPKTWSGQAVAMTTTHDLPTAAGWWQGRDIDWHERVGTEPDAMAARQRREAERTALAALVPEVEPGHDGVDLAIAAVSEAASALVLVPIEDLLGLVEQPNLPGTIDEHPNWCRRLPAAADELLDVPEARRRTERLRALRGG